MIEVIGTRTNAEIQAIKLAYGTHYQRDLEADVASETGGKFKRLLVGLLQVCSYWIVRLSCGTAVLS